jgi:hypothetical protein
LLDSFDHNKVVAIYINGFHFTLKEVLEFYGIPKKNIETLSQRKVLLLIDNE